MARNRSRKSRYFTPAASIADQVRTSKRWEKWEEELICSLHAEGNTYGQISRSLPGRTKAACKRRALKELRTQILPNGQKRWEDWEDQLLLVHREAGESNGKISELLSHRTASAVNTRFHRALKSRIEATIAAPTATRSRHRWKLGNDRLLKFLGESGQSWTEIAKNFPDRTVTQFISHWYRMLQPPRDKRWKEWEEWEEQLLVSGYYAGLSWEEIAKSIPGRTKVSVRRHWNLQFWLPKQDRPWTSEETYHTHTPPR